MNVLIFFDCSCMIGPWPEKPLFFSDIAGLKEEMNRFHIAEALVTHTASWKASPADGNRELVLLLDHEPDLHPVIVLTPLLDEEFGGVHALSDFVVKHKCAAIRLFPRDHAFTLNPFNQSKIFDFAKQMHLPVFLDSEQASERFDLIYSLLKAHPTVPLVLSCPIYAYSRIVYDLFEQCPNLYGDMTFFNGFKAIEQFVCKFGSERLLFSTNMPFVEGGLNVFNILYSELTEAEKQNIAYTNAHRLFSSGRPVNA